MIDEQVTATKKQLHIRTTDLVTQCRRSGSTESVSLNNQREDIKLQMHKFHSMIAYSITT